jgi:outer membrane immunogenic protein
MRKATLASIISLTAVIGTGIGTSSDANADGYVRDKSFAPLPVYNWSGVYFGVNGGWGGGQSDIKEFPLQITGVPIPSELSGSNNINGGLGGVQLGLNKQWGPWVLGGEFRLSGARIDGSTNDCAGATTAIANIVGPGMATLNCQTDVRWIAAGLGRLGYAWNRWLTYGTLGWAVAGVDYTSSVTVTPGANLTITVPSGANDTADGLAFGGGVEYAVTDSVTFGVEYTGMNLESKGSGVFVGGVVTSGSREIDLNTVTARLNLKLGGGW